MTLPGPEEQNERKVPLTDFTSIAITKMMDDNEIPAGILPSSRLIDAARIIALDRRSYVPEEPPFLPNKSDLRISDLQAVYASYDPDEEQEVDSGNEQ